MTAREKIHSGDLYLPTDDGMFEEQQRYMELLYEFNHTRQIGRASCRERVL